MEILSKEIVFEVLIYLDLKSLHSFGQVSKYFSLLFHDPVFWRLKQQLVQESSPLKLSAYFRYSPQAFSSLLFSKEPLDFTYDLYKSLVIQLKHPRSIIKSSLHSHINQPLNGLLKYEDELFWNSKQREDCETTESVLIELIENSIVHSVNFKIYRAVWQGGALFPPKFFKIFIGNTENEFHYESVLYKAPMSEKYCTVLVLPEVVKGRYVKIDLIGKVTPMPNSNLFITALEFVDIIGTTDQTSVENKLETSIVDNDIDTVVEIIDRNKQKSTPFIIDLMERSGVLKTVIGKLTRPLNEAESFVYIRDRLFVPVDMNNIKPSEALGDLCFESGAFSKAFYNYSKIMDIWKLCKTAIVLKHTETIKYILNKHEPRYPRFIDILAISKTLGVEFEEFVRTQI